jgi:hypothetical protein
MQEEQRMGLGRKLGYIIITVGLGLMVGCGITEPSVT